MTSRGRQRAVVFSGRTLARAGTVPAWSTFGKPGCTGKNEDDDPGGKPRKHPVSEITKPGCGGEPEDAED